MEEQQPRPPGHALDGRAQRTGVASVDAVLEEVAGLADRPVSEHVAAFDRAHDQLRRSLDAHPDA